MEDGGEWYGSVFSHKRCFVPWSDQMSVVFAADGHCAVSLSVFVRTQDAHGDQPILGDFSGHGNVELNGTTPDATTVIANAGNLS